MSLYYITGVPGVGKSTIQKNLEERGYEAYDIDDSRFGGPVNLKTGESVKVPPAEDRKPEWFNQHEWRISRIAVEKLKQESENKTVFLCGTATTENLVWDLFDKVFYLEIDEETLRHRLANRLDNDFGKTEDEFDIILKRYKEAQSKVPGMKAILIDARQNIDVIVESITNEI